MMFSPFSALIFPEEQPQRVLEPTCVSFQPLTSLFVYTADVSEFQFVGGSFVQARVLGLPAATVKLTSQIPF